jgi:hypothetical protein
MRIPIRLSEPNQSPEQLAQRDKTYEAAELLLRAGFRCHVTEFFVNKGTRQDSACIILDLGESNHDQ